MNPIRQRRLVAILALVVAAGIAVALAAVSLSRNVSFLYSPTEVHNGEAANAARFRLGGVVCEGSVSRQTGTLAMDFVVTDRVSDVPVRFEGILPDLFREGQSIIASGAMQDGAFVATEVLAKHDETYMPPEVAEKLAEAQATKPTTHCRRLNG